MASDTGGKARGGRLRRDAERRLDAVQMTVTLPLDKGEELKLIHELQVHQIELEMQNEELQRSHEELRSARDRYALLYDFAPIGYLTLDRNWKIRTVNLVGAGFLGRERARVVNQPFCRFIAAENTAKCGDFLERVFSGTMVERAELKLRQGKERISFMQVEAVAVESGEECLVAMVDITVRKEMEATLARSVGREREEMAGRLQALEELRKNELLLLQQNRMAAMGEMLNNIAHQWRQPLNVLGLLIQEILISSRNERIDRELIDENLSKAIDTLHHLSQTIDDFREFSMPDREKSPFRVGRVLSRVLQMVGDHLMGQGIAVDCSCTDDPEIVGYPNEYGQVLMNLLMNCRDAYQDSDATERWIRIRSWKEEGRGVLTVTDNAGGIDEEIMSKVFDAYFTTKELGKGTGIGLFMSKMIIEKNMGGRLSARNLAGGTEFRIEV